MLSKIDRYLLARSKALIGLCSILLMAGLGAADHYTGPEISFSIFYLAPVALASWYGTPLLSVLICLISSLLWLAADLSAGQVYSHAAIPFWNAAVRLGFFMVVSALLMRLHRQLRAEEQMADTDPLTGLANRRSFLERARFEIERSKRYRHPFTLAYIDLDNFKAVNDTRGHDEGDALLIKVGEILNSNSRHTDVVCRLGGDEFAALFSDTGYTAAAEAIRKAHTLLLNAMEEKGWPVTFSIGAISFEAAMHDIRDIIKMADDLMYEVKKTGKNRIEHWLWNGKELKAA
jgi:diguanylate cyclase (GGDEF)-like protein